QELLVEELGIEDRGSRIEDRGSKIEKGGKKTAKGGGNLQSSIVDPHSSNLVLDSPAVRFGWQPYLPELLVTVQTHVTLGPRTGRVQQRILFDGAQRVPRRVLLRLPDAPKTDPGLVQGVPKSPQTHPAGRPEDAAVENAGPGSWSIALNPEKDPYLDVSYTFPRPASGRVAVPLLWLEQATGTETKVRVWSEPEGAWQTRA